MSDPVLRTRRVAPELRKAAILDAALAQFSVHGFSVTRMEDVARGAQVSKGTVYLYYPTKQALFEALVRRDVGPKVETIRCFLDVYEGPLRPALLQISGVLGEIIDSGRMPIYPKLLVAEANRFPELVIFYRREVVGVILDALAGLFKRAVLRAEIAKVDPVMTAHLFIAPLLKAMMWSLTFATSEDVPFQATPYFNAHVDLFFKGLKNEN